MAHPGYEKLSPIIAHRGASGSAPENTRAAFELAIREGASWIETDVAITADKQAVLFHDIKLERCSPAQGWLVQRSLSELAQLDVGGWFAPEFSHERLVRLESLIELANSTHTGLNLEIKPVYGLENETVDALTESFSRVPPQVPIIISSFHTRALGAAKQRLAEFQRGLLTEAIPSDWRQRCETLDCQGLHACQDLVTLEQVEGFCSVNARHPNSPVHLLLYTLNNRHKAQQLLNAGVSAVFTDFPEKLL